MSFINKIPNFFILNRIRSSTHLYNYSNVLKISGAFKLPHCEPCQSCHYSTLHDLKHRKYKKYSSIHSKPALSFVSFLSTDAKEEKLQVVFTNPIDNTTSTSEIIIKPPEAINDFSHVASSSEVIQDSASEIIDTSTSIADVASLVSAVEPSMESLGLVTNSPVGLVIRCIEYFHVNMDMPWWMAIATCTVIVRIALIPLLIRIQKNAIRMSNIMPQLHFIQAKFQEARKSGNSIEASRYASEMMMFMKEHKVSPIKNAMLPLMQAPIFISFFMGLRKMAKLPVESMKDGGISWTLDLTIPDPYYVLPVICCSTLYVVLRIGAESGVKMDSLKMSKYLFQALPIIMFPFCINFPSAVLYYWCTNNFCTLAIVSAMKIKPVREFLKMPVQQPPNPKFVANKKGFVQGMKESFEDHKVLATIEDRRRVDAVTFQKAGTGPIPRTYPYDPTKPRPASAAAAAGVKSQAKGLKT